MDQIKVYTTKSTSLSTMSLPVIPLRETKTTRLLFFPMWAQESQNPLRGGFVFQRKSPIGVWENISYESLTTLKKDEGYQLNLDGEEVLKLISEFENLKSLYSKQGMVYGEHSVRVVENNVDGIFIQITDPSKKQMVIDSLEKLEQDKFDGLSSILKKTSLDKIINEFEINMTNSDESFWQKFFEKNPEIFQYLFPFPLIYLNGETYLGGKNTKGRQGAGGTATDFLIQNNSNGSFGVVDIKTPLCKLVGCTYRGTTKSGYRNELSRIHGNLSGGIVQLENQMFTAIKYFETVLGPDYDKLNFLNPTGLLIAGNQLLLDEEQRKSFNLFRKSLGKNQIITFDEVLSKLKLINELL